MKSEQPPCIGITILMNRVLPATFDKALGLVAAHRTNLCDVYPCATPVRNEGDTYLTEQEWDYAGNIVTFQTKFRVGRDVIDVGMSSPALCGNVFTRFTPARDATKVSMECDFGDCDNNKHYDEEQLSEFADSVLDQMYSGYLRYLNISGK